MQFTVTVEKMGVPTEKLRFQRETTVEEVLKKWVEKSCEDFAGCQARISYDTDIGQADADTVSSHDSISETCRLFLIPKLELGIK